MDETIGLFAGEGDLSVEIARRLFERGRPPLVFSFEEKTAPLEKWALEVTRVERPALGELLGKLRSRGIKNLVLAGFVPKSLIFRPDLLDDDLGASSRRCPSGMTTLCWGPSYPFSSPGASRYCPTAISSPNCLPHGGPLPAGSPFPGRKRISFTVCGSRRPWFQCLSARR